MKICLRPKEKGKCEKGQSKLKPLPLNELNFSIPDDVRDSHKRTDNDKSPLTEKLLAQMTK